MAVGGWSEVEEGSTVSSTQAASTAALRASSDVRFSDDFSWDVSDQWRNVDLQAAARETLPLSSLFFAIDVCVRP